MVIPLFWLQVKCRLVMFRPFVGEIIDAKLKDYDENGLHCMYNYYSKITFHTSNRLYIFP